jgi:hypothetical protein
MVRLSGFDRRRRDAALRRDLEQARHRNALDTVATPKVSSLLLDDRTTLAGLVQLPSR